MGTYNEYKATVNGLVEDILTEYPYDSEQSDNIFECVDGSELVIYNWGHSVILEHSNNADYGTDEGLVEATGDLNELKQGLAFYALYADVIEELNERGELI